MHEDGETAPPPPASWGRGGTASPGPGKAETLRRLHILKKRIAVLTVLSFGVLSGLVAGHHMGAAAQSNPAAPAATTAPTPAPSTDQGNGFFDQGGASDQGNYGYGFGNGGSQRPVAGSGAS
jgi:hypothetical protein